MLSASAIKQILTAEFEANQVKLIVHKRSIESVERVKAESEKTVAASKLKAETEIEHLKKTTDQKAMEYAAELASTTANRLATMSARAEKRLDTVAQRIFERIVNI